MDPQNQNHFLKSLVFTFPTFKRELAITLQLVFLIFLFVLFINLAGSFQPHSLLRIGSAKLGFLSAILPATTHDSTHQTEKKTICDYSNGRWDWDDSISLQHYSEDCPFLDPGFKCHRNGRVDKDYLNWRWQPSGCDLPRFNASDMLERSRNGRVVFAGDSIGRNQWESLVCMLAQAVSNKSRIYEQNGNPISKHKGYLSIRFEDYNCSVEYYRVPFLVTVDRPPEKSPSQVRSAIRIDKLHWRSRHWVGSDILVFNAGHWWNHEKTVKMGCYFQEGEAVNMSMDVTEAFRRSLETWKQWVLQDLALASKKSHVFFRSYSPTHFKGGTWMDGGQCDSNTGPDTSIKPDSEPWNNKFISEAIEQIKDIKRNVQFLNITYLTEFRKDGHPSIHREEGMSPLKQDCSHWCLPGVPDAWNELLYAYLLSKCYDTKNKTTNENGH